MENRSNSENSSALLMPERNTAAIAVGAWRRMPGSVPEPSSNLNSDQQLATRYRFTVTVSVKVDDLSLKKTLWENPALSFSDEYDLASSSSVSLDTPAFLEQERAAIDRLSSDFAKSVVSAILEAF